MNLPRHADWPTRLDAAVQAARDVPFDWKTHNCATFCADCAEAMTGVSLHERFRDQVATSATAQAASASVEAYADAILGARISPRQARRGDIVAVPTPEGNALGVCLGARVAAVGPHGLSFYPLGVAVCAWQL